MNEAEQPSSINSAQLPLVVHVVSYRDTRFPRNTSIVAALESIPGIRVVCAHNTSAGFYRYIETYRALRTIAASHPIAVIVLGFRSHEFFWPIVMRFGGRSKIIVDALMSPYAAMSEEKKLGSLGRWLAPLVYLLERSILRRANIVFTDTQAHCRYYQDRFGLHTEKTVAVPVGAPGVQPAADLHTTNSDMFNVLFFGSMLPLHGIEVVIAAARMVSDAPIRFDIIGGSEDIEQQLVNAKLPHYTYRRFVPFEQLTQQLIGTADLCLGGPFGNTAQAMRVITTKTSLCLAAGKPTVVGINAALAGFEDKHNCLLVPQGDPSALAEAIRWAFEHQTLLRNVGNRGRFLYDKTLSPEVAAHIVQNALTPLIATTPTSK